MEYIIRAKEGPTVEPGALCPQVNDQKRMERQDEQANRALQQLAGEARVIGEIGQIITSTLESNRSMNASLWS
jgi:hypothetical protein